MIKKIVFLLIFFYFLIILQTSFFIHFDIFGIIPNFVLIAVVIINLFFSRSLRSGLIASFIAGFYLDVFSLSPVWFFGFYTLISVAVSLFINLILKEHVHIPTFKKT